eukprot:gene9002-1615_t
MFAEQFRVVLHEFTVAMKQPVIDLDLDGSWYGIFTIPLSAVTLTAGYISIRLFSREASSAFKIEGPYTLRIVNKDPLKHVTKQTEASSREWADSIRGWGFPAFSKVEDISEPSAGFLADNKVIIEVEVNVASIVETVDFHPDLYHYDTPGLDLSSCTDHDDQ